MEIQRLILIDFTALNGGIKKGSIDAILLSIEMIEKGFRSNRISKRETHTGLPPLNQILILKFEFSKYLCSCVHRCFSKNFMLCLNFLAWSALKSRNLTTEEWQFDKIAKKPSRMFFCYFLQPMFPSERHLRKILCDVSSFVCA